MRFLLSLDPVKHADMIADLKNPDTVYPVDLISMCDLATNWCSKSSSSKNGFNASLVMMMFQISFLIISITHKTATPHFLVPLFRPIYAVEKNKI